MGGIYDEEAGPVSGVTSPMSSFANYLLLKRIARRHPEKTRKCSNSLWTLSWIPNYQVVVHILRNFTYFCFV
jgi:hypothetical protein